MSDQVSINITEDIDLIEVNITEGSVQTVTGGEANTASNVGTGAGLSVTKVGVDLPFKSLVAGSNITLNESATEIELVATVPAVDSTKIQDTAGTASVDTEDATYANQVILKAPAATTGLILQAFSGATPNFQVDGNGNIFNNSNIVIKRVGTSVQINSNDATDTSGNTHVIIGYSARIYSNLYYQNIAIGYRASTGGNYTISIGGNAGYGASGCASAIFIGNSAGLSAYNSPNKIAIGYNAGNGSNSSSGMYLGDYAGKAFTSGAYIVLDMLDRTDLAGGLSKAPIVASYDATAANQFLRTNTKFCVNVAPLTNQVAGDIQAGNCLIIPEITTPTADTNFGKIYTKSDNKIYFQDGGGTEHEIAFV